MLGQLLNTTLELLVDLFELLDLRARNHRGKLQYRNLNSHAPHLLLGSVDGGGFIAQTDDFLR